MGIDMGTEMGMDMGTEKLELKLEWDTSRNSLFLCVQQLLSNIVSLFAVLLCLHTSQITPNTSLLAHHS